MATISLVILARKTGIASTARALANSRVVSSKWCRFTRRRMRWAYFFSLSFPPLLRTSRDILSRDSSPMVRPDIKPAHQHTHTHTHTRTTITHTHTHTHSYSGKVTGVASVWRISKQYNHQTWTSQGTFRAIILPLPRTTSEIADQQIITNQHTANHHHQLKSNLLYKLPGIVASSSSYHRACPIAVSD